MSGDKFYPDAAANTRRVTIVVVFFLLILLLGGITYFSYNYPRTPDPQIPQKTPLVARVDSPRIYQNDQFRFRVTLPSGWIEKKFQSGISNDDIVIAFGLPQNLPTAAYTDGDYIGIRIYSVLSQEYSTFVSGRNTALQSPSQLANLGGSLAFKNNFILATERSGNVYELHLSKNMSDSNDIVSSFMFVE